MREEGGGINNQQLTNICIHDKGLSINKISCEGGGGGVSKKARKS